MTMGVVGHVWMRVCVCVCVWMLCVCVCVSEHTHSAHPASVSGRGGCVGLGFSCGGVLPSAPAAGSAGGVAVGFLGSWKAHTIALVSMRTCTEHNQTTMFYVLAERA